jgi:HNH endonuclease
MDESFVRRVRVRAKFACEYCRLPVAYHPGPFEIEHVLPRQHGGFTTFANCALACLRCNRNKGTNLAGIDLRTSRTKLVRLFNPRRHVWTYHFEWDGPRVVGRTPIGRVTVELLDMNEPVRVALRDLLIREGLFPRLE